MRKINCMSKTINTKNLVTKPSLFSLLFITIASISSLSGCATSQLLESDSHTNTSSVKNVLIEDQVIAFGKPAIQLSNMPANSVVIVGNKKSYVLSQGGVEFVQLLSGLDANNIQVDKELAFQSKNDGYFAGNVSLSYAKLTEDFSRSDMQFFLQNGGKECTTSSDSRMHAQRFCFNINIKGGIYPQVSNLSLIQSKYKPLTKPYSISIYTTKKVTHTTNSGNPIEKLVLLPFALAFDVVTMPLQIFSQ